MRVTVRDNDVSKALKVLKKKMQQEGILREMRKRECYYKPSELRVIAEREAITRERKREKKRIERDGF